MFKDIQKSKFEYGRKSFSKQILNFSFFAIFLSPSVSGRIRTVDFRIISWVFYLCAAVAVLAIICQSYIITQIVKLWVCWMHVMRYLGAVQTPSSNCSILIETPLAGKALVKWSECSSYGFDKPKICPVWALPRLRYSSIYCSKKSSGWKPTHITSVNIRIYICLSPHGTTNTPWVLRDTDVHRESTDVR